ncbi:MAG: tetratricopeptide repeat protein [Candidatus Acidiferrales bacterium]
MFALLLCASGAARAQSAAKNCQPPPELQQKLNAQPSPAAYDALGAYFGDRKEFACAISAFRASLRLDPKSWKTRYYLALVLLSSGNPQQAARELRVSLELHPDQPEAHLTLGAALSQLHQTDAAIEQFQIVLQKDPASVTALDWLAKAYLSQKRYAAVIFLLQNAPADEVLQMDLVIAYSQSGDTARALKILSRMEQDHPSSPLPHSGLGMAYTQLHRYEEAAAEFKQALKINPQDDLALVSYLKVLIVLGQFQAAQPLAQDYLRAHPGDFDANYLVGVIERELGNYAEAKDRLAEAVRMNPEHYDARYNLGIALAKMGQPAAARVQLEKAVQLNPQSAEAHFQLASVLRALSLPEAAQAQFALYQQVTAEQAKKDVAVTKANQAKQLMQQGDAQKAVDLYRDALQNDPQNSQILFELAMALDRQGDFHSEEDALAQAIAANPDFAAAHNQMGQLIFQAGRTADAEKEFKAAIQLNPHYAEAQSNLGVLYGQQGRDADAETYFRQAIASDPQYAQAYVNLAAALADQSRFAEAESAAEAALRIAPDNQEARELQTKLQAELDKHRDAPR